MILPVIMAGGSGSRLWPLSRKLFPKQFINLTSEKSMLQETILRLEGLEHQAPLIICNDEHRFVVAEQLRKENIEHSEIILEPVGRNTAPAIALAALYAIKQGKDPLLLVLAADHVIQNKSAFNLSIKSAVPLALNENLVTFGIVPTSPETGYGYIRQGLKESDSGFRVAEFIEKPDLIKANNYLVSGEYFWNSGMFLFKASRYLSELQLHRPDIFYACEKAMQGAHKDLDFLRLDDVAFAACPDDSIDYAVMEKTKDAIVVPMDADWNDVGSFNSLWQVSEKDESNNVVFGDVITENTTNSYIYSQNKLVSTLGVNNLVVIETQDAILVADKDQTQDVKKIVQKLKIKHRAEYEQHEQIFRPWGSADILSKGNGFQVKSVFVKPGDKTSLQMHYHRAEHWIVVQGTAKVINGDKTYFLSENESTYIPQGTKHRLENPGKINLHVIEVRSGDYLDEDDIVRYENYKDQKITNKSLNSKQIIQNSNIKFGTSGARGLVEQFTSEVCMAFTHSFLASLTKFDFNKVAIAIDNRPSSYSMAQACIAAIQSRKIEVDYYGVLPTPALAYCAMQDNIPCIMVTGSHIPFDRNGLKFYRPDGEITKTDEENILKADETFFMPEKFPIPKINNTGSKKYIQRYTRLFSPDFLQGKRIGLYEHSSAGRDLYQSLFKALGAEVISLDRTDNFVPIDTEALSDTDKEKALKWSNEYALDYIFSTDGDGDRPLAADENGIWLQGDILCLLCAKILNIDALAIPISCNSMINIDMGFSNVCRTKIGSPFVIDYLDKLSEHHKTVAGFEANGGFLLGTDIIFNDKTIKALPTRDAVLPFLMLLFAAKKSSIYDLINQLPNRYTHSDRISNFSTEKSIEILTHAKDSPSHLLNQIGFSGIKVTDSDETDGLRLTLSNNTIVHLRPSGNAPELRCYAEANSLEMAKSIVDQTLSRIQILQ